VLDPDVIVADEPVSSLDASVRGEILKLILALRDDLGLSALVVSHDLGLAWNIADRVAVMYLGRIVEMTDRKSLFEMPLHPYTEALLSAVPIPKASARLAMPQSRFSIRVCLASCSGSFASWPKRGTCHSSMFRRSAERSRSSFLESSVFPDPGSPTIK